MPNVERCRKRKESLLLESAVKCKKLSDLFQRQESLQSVSVTIQNTEAANHLITAGELSINENAITTPDKKSYSH